MLVLSRKVGEKLIIGDNITVVINRVAGNRVTIGIDAPDDVRVVRGELKPTVQEFSVMAEPIPAAGRYDRTSDAIEVSVPRLAK